MIWKSRNVIMSELACWAVVIEAYDCVRTLVCWAVVIEAYDCVRTLACWAVVIEAYDCVRTLACWAVVIEAYDCVRTLCCWAVMIEAYDCVRTLACWAVVIEAYACVRTLSGCDRSIWLCQNSGLLSGTGATWTSYFGGGTRRYWGGSEERDGMCGCAITGQCADATKTCNCNTKDGTERFVGISMTGNSQYSNVIFYNPWISP